MLHAVLDERGVSRAARRLGCTQSAVSHNLAALREHFDDPLLVSNGRAMARTSLGNDLFARTGSALEAVGEVFARRARFEPSSSTRTFEVIASASAFWLPELLEQLVNEAPGVRVRVTAPPPALPDEALASRASVAFVVGARATSRPRIHHTPLPPEPFWVVLGRGLERSPSLDLQTYCALEHVLLAPYGGARGVVDASLEALGRARFLRATVPSFGALGPLLTRAPLITTLPERAARWLATAYQLELREPPLRIDPLRPALVWHERVHQSPDEIWFRQRLRESLRASSQRRD